MKPIDLVLVIQYDRHDNPDGLWLEPKEHAIKRTLANNFSGFIHSRSSKDDLELFNKVLELCQANKWSEAEKYWNECEINIRGECHRPMVWYDLDKAPSLDQDLKWIKTALLYEI